MSEQTCDRYGVAQQGTSANRPRNAWDGFTYYDTDLRSLLVWDATVKNWFAARGGLLYSAATPRMMSDDFKGSAIDSRYSLAKGSDNLAAYPAHVAGKHYGEVALVTGDAGDTTAHDASALAGPAVEWEAEEGEITLEFRFKLSAITDVACFIGLTDTLPATTLEMPATLATTTYTTTATDAVGLLFDTAATTDTLRAVGVKADTDATHVNTSLAPVADTYEEWKIVVSTAGVAKFYKKITGVWTLKATVENSVSPGVDLVPIAIAEARTTASRTLSLDYWSMK